MNEYWIKVDDSPSIPAPIACSICTISLGEQIVICLKYWFVKTSVYPSQLGEAYTNWEGYKVLSMFVSWQFYGQIEYQGK